MSETEEAAASGQAENEVFQGESGAGAGETASGEVEEKSGEGADGRKGGEGETALDADWGKSGGGHASSGIDKADGGGRDNGFSQTSSDRIGNGAGGADADDDAAGSVTGGAGTAEASNTADAARAAESAGTEHLSGMPSALSVSGTQLVDASGNLVQLRGISTHGIAWYPQYVNAECFRQLRDEWGMNVIRLAMYKAESGGYCTDGNQDGLKELVKNGVQYATDCGMYVIIDWHILSDGNPGRVWGKLCGLESGQ